MGFANWPKRITQILGLAVLFLFFAGLAAQITTVLWGAEGYLSVLRLFDVSVESSVPTWYSSVALLLCSVLLAVISLLKKNSGDRYVPHWSILSIVFLYMSVDEVAMIHETLGKNIGNYLVATYIDFLPKSFIKSFLTFSWIVPYSILVLIGLLAYLRFLSHLPRKTLLFFLVAGALFLVGALGMEILESQYIFSLKKSRVAVVGDKSTWPVDFLVWYAVSRSLEEGLEMLGIVVFIHALLSYVSSYIKTVAGVVEVGPKDE